MNKTKLDTDDLSNYDIYSFDKIESADRREKILKIVTKDTPEYIHKTFSTLCSIKKYLH